MPIYLEFIQRGRYIKVTAIDSDSGQEASIIGDPKAGQRALGKLAVKKLELKMKQGKRG